jgi:hypothetical protein
MLLNISDGFAVINEKQQPYNLLQHSARGPTYVKDTRMNEPRIIDRNIFDKQTREQGTYAQHSMAGLSIDSMIVLLTYPGITNLLASTGVQIKRCIG